MRCPMKLDPGLRLQLQRIDILQADNPKIPVAEEYVTFVG